MNFAIPNKIITNISWRIIAVIISRLMAFLVIPLITRSLGADGYGRYSFYLNLITYIVLPINLGFLAYGTREIAKSLDSNSVLSKLINIKLLFAATIFLVFIVITLLISTIDYLTLIISLILLADTFKIDFFYYGKKNVVVPTIATFVGQSFFVSAVIILFRKNVDDYLLYILAFASYKIIENFIPWIIYLQNNLFPKIGIDNVKIKTVKNIYFVGLLNRTFFFLTTLPILIFPLFAEYSILGKYSVIIKFFGLTFLIFNTLLFPIAPYIVKIQSDDEQVRKRKKKLISKMLILTFIVAFAESLAFYFFGNVVLKVFGADFIASDLTIILVSISLLLWTLNIFLIVIISYRDKEKEVIKKVLIGVLAFLIASIFLLLRSPLEGIFSLFIVVNVYLMFVLLGPVIRIIKK